MSDQNARPVTLPQTVWEEIVAHAREGTPEEICGILRGRGLAASEIIRGRNVAEERIENYTVDPQTLLKQFDFEEDGDEMMGIYHSHPVSEAYPSATDAWNAHYPECIYLICSLEQNDAPVVRAFRMTPSSVDLDLEGLVAGVPFDEVRSGLFGYFVQGSAEPVPSMARLLEQTPAPFYIVFATSDGDIGNAEGRIVSIVEHPIELT